MNKRTIFLLVFVFVIAGGAGVYYLTREAHDHAGSAPDARPKVEYYTCSMHPFVREADPGNCPICAMKLQPVYQNRPSEVDHPAEPGAVHVSADEARLLGLRTIRVKRGISGEPIRTVGRVEVNEKTLEHVHTRFDGWVEELHVNAVGQKIRKGDPLFSIYSPAVLAAQEEYLLALRAAAMLGENADPTAALQTRNLVAAARDRLVLWEIPPDLIHELESTGRSRRAVTMRAHSSGYVISRNVAAGQRIMPGSDLYVVADLSNVWVTAEIYESDLEFVRVGQAATAAFAGLAGSEFKGTISFIYPYIDETTRTNKIRIELDNPKSVLKPGMFGEITIRKVETETTGLFVPTDAVMVTGRRNIVFKQVGEGVYAPIEVKLGRATRGHYQISSSLEEGDVVVERGNFFLDSESQLRLTGAGAHAGGHTGAADPSAKSP